MRYYLDTNILVFTMLGRGDNDIAGDTMELLADYSTVKLTSVICVQELMYLCQTGKLAGARKKPIDARTLIDVITEFNVTIVPFTERHLHTLARLPMFSDHRDPSDRMIIAQAISDRIPLISSDGKFDRYIPQGLEFVYNER